MSILQRLEDWSESRGITRQVPSVEGYVANITEELGEWLEAQKEGDEDDSIDAVADITVFSITEMFKIGHPLDTDTVDILSGKGFFIEWYIWMCENPDTSRNEFNLRIIKYLGDCDYEDMPFDINIIIYICLQKMVIMGYNPILVMDEVLKVVESRVGEWDDVNKKFQKDTSPEAKANWYKPNYKRAKR